MLAVPPLSSFTSSLSSGPMWRSLFPPHWWRSGCRDRLEEPRLCGSLCLRPPSTHANRPPFRFTAERDRSRGDSGLADLLEGRISGIYRLGGVHGEPATARGQSQSL